MRISISDECYWLLASCAVKEHMRPNALLEKWILEHRDEMPEKQSANKPERQGMPPDSSRPKGTFSPVEIDQIKQLHRKGLTPGKIAKSLGRHKSSVAYAVDRLKKRREL